MNIVFCADGTWNDPTDQTNVYELFSLLGGDVELNCDRTSVADRYLYKEAPGQKAFYVQGVGAHGTRNDVLQGAVGVGLHARVLDGYILISRAYRPGDKIYIFGFSRGAYTARALASMIAGAGLIDAAEASTPVARAHANLIWWDLKHLKHRLIGDGPDSEDESPIHLVGVWDTVGALGVPDFTGLHVIDKAEKRLFDFVDTSLSARVRHARHAVAIDSRRVDFEPTLWDARDGIEQVWFAGVHSDVGGGYRERGLADVTLEWMLDEASSLGLQLQDGWRAALAPDPAADRHESYTEPIWTTRGKPVHRSVPADAVFHPSVDERFAKRSDYRPEPLRNHRKYADFYDEDTVVEERVDAAELGQNRKLAVGESATVEVFAQKWWNAARVAVEAGQEYRVEATGHWSDWHTVSDPDGYEKSLLDGLKWARRVPDAPWFCLVAAVHESHGLEDDNASLAKGILGEAHRRDNESQLVPVGDAGTVRVSRPGYLYLFANDAPVMYSNNDGSVHVTVTRTA